MNPHRTQASAVKRLVTRLLGNGPRSAKPLAEILSALTPENADWGWCGPEQTFGPVGRFETPSFRYPPAHHVGKPRHEIIDGRSRFQDPFIAPRHTCTAYALPDGAIIGRDGLIYHAPSRAAVLETTVQWWSPGRSSVELWAPRRPAPSRLSGAALCLRCLGGQSFYHFLTESLSRLAVLRPLIDHVEHVLVSVEPGTWALQWLEQARVPKEKLVFCDGTTHLAFDTVFFATPFLKEQQPTPDHVTALNAIYFEAGNEPSSRPKRAIYLSRRDAGSRHWPAEEAFCEQNPDLEVVALAGLNPQTQRDVFAGASLIVGVHGANLASVVFCRPPFQVVELFPERGYTPMYYRWAHAVGGQHAAVHLEGPADVQAAQATKALREIRVRNATCD